ncbi:MAG: hypothetical protein GX877_03855, partial [Bacteroidales bacterium]|nr:hypothetical protein [Bacteroidales bacterium]
MKKIICYLLMMMLLVSCGPQERPLVPIVVTVEVTMVTTTTASCECEVTADNDFSVIARGVCWSTSENPTIEDSTTSNGSGLGSYTAHLTGLSPNTTYYV